jgi:hypothetical protein
VNRRGDAEGVMLHTPLALSGLMGTLLSAVVRVTCSGSI